MATNIRTIAEMQAEMTNDEARAWIHVAHWTYQVDKYCTKHLIIKSRTVIREYVVDWTSHSPVVTDMPAEYAIVGNTIKSSELKELGYKRNKGTLAYNEVTREISTL